MGIRYIKNNHYIQYFIYYFLVCLFITFNDISEKSYSTVIILLLMVLVVYFVILGFKYLFELAILKGISCIAKKTIPLNMLVRYQCYSLVIPSMFLAIVLIVNAILGKGIFHFPILLTSQIIYLLVFSYLLIGKTKNIVISLVMVIYCLSSIFINIR